MICYHTYIQIRKLRETGGNSGKHKETQGKLGNLGKIPKNSGQLEETQELKESRGNLVNLGNFGSAPRNSKSPHQNLCLDRPKFVRYPGRDYKQGGTDFFEGKKGS